MHLLNQLSNPAGILKAGVRRLFRRDGEFPPGALRRPVQLLADRPPPCGGAAGFRGLFLGGGMPVLPRERKILSAAGGAGPAHRLPRAEQGGIHFQPPDGDRADAGADQKL